MKAYLFFNETFLGIFSEGREGSTNPLQKPTAEWLDTHLGHRKPSTGTYSILFPILYKKNVKCSIYSSVEQTLFPPVSNSGFPDIT